MATNRNLCPAPLRQVMRFTVSFLRPRILVLSGGGGFWILASQAQMVPEDKMSSSAIQKTSVTRSQEFWDAEMTEPWK